MDRVDSKSHHVFVGTEVVVKLIAADDHAWLFDRHRRTAATPNPQAARTPTLLAGAADTKLGLLPAVTGKTTSHHAFEPWLQFLSGAHTHLACNGPGCTGPHWSDLRRGSCRVANGGADVVATDEHRRAGCRRLHRTLRRFQLKRCCSHLGRYCREGLATNGEEGPTQRNPRWVASVMNDNCSTNDLSSTSWQDRMWRQATTAGTRHWRWIGRVCCR